MIKGFDGDPHALGDRLDVMFQRGFGCSMAQMGLDVLDGGELGHVRRAGAPEHLVRDALYAGVLTGFLQDSEEKIVGVNGCAASGREDKSLGARMNTRSRNSPSSGSV